MKRALVVAAVVFAAACGGSSSPSSPTTDSNSGALSATGSFTISLQQVFMTNNTIAFAWASTGASTYKLTVGSASGLSDVMTADVTGTSYTWTAPRTAAIYYARVAPTSGGQTGTASVELPVFALDMRFIIDALFFGSGPMSDNSTTSSVAMWPEGATINTLVTDESGSQSLDVARTFATNYAAAAPGHVTISINTTPTDYHGTSNSAIPQNTVIVRVYQVCPQTGVIACANYGPAPVGPGNSFVNLNAAPANGNTGGSVSVSHEIGHSFGLHHLVTPSANRPEFKFLMNPVLISGVDLTAIEKNAITAARSGGLRTGWTRTQAAAAGLVFQNPAGVSVPSAFFERVRDVIEPGAIR